MKYLQSSFTVGPAVKSTACERCVYGSGEHAGWCYTGKKEAQGKLGGDHTHTEKYKRALDERKAIRKARRERLVDVMTFMYC